MPKNELIFRLVLDEKMKMILALLSQGWGDNEPWVGAQGGNAWPLR
jgi:hypothetical protein